MPDSTELKTILLQSESGRLNGKWLLQLVSQL